MEKVVIQNCTIYHGDCLEMLETIPPGSIDLCWTDPPFGISYVPNSRKVLEIPDMLANDDKPRLDFVPPVVKTVKNGGAIYLCTRFDVAPLWSGALVEAGAKIKNPIYWVKDNMSKGDLHDRGNCVEIVLCAHVGRHLLRGKRVMNAWMIPRPEIQFHPTPKPVELVRRCIVASSDFGDTVLEPFLGGGSTAVACALCWNLSRCRYIEANDLETGIPFSQFRSEYLSEPSRSHSPSRSRAKGEIKSGRGFPSAVSRTAPVSKD